MSAHHFEAHMPYFEDPGPEEENRRREVEAAELEKSLADFTDEPPIHQDVYPESESEEDEVEDRFAIQEISRPDSSLFKGQILFDRRIFAAAVLDHALRGGRNIKQYRYDKTKMGFCCVGTNCNWRIYCARVSQLDKWEVRVYIDVHTCTPNGVCKMLKVPVIARMFVDKIREEPEYFMPMKMQELILEKWKISVSRGQCQVARYKALKWINNEYTAQFARLRDYAAEILHSNPNSSVDVETERSEEGLDLFSRFYVCLDSIRKSWKETCRPLIGVDGCFLRSNMKGQLLVAVGKDGNNAIYPIAWGVVQVENKPNWIWFLQKLKVDLGLESGEGYIIVSDRQKGLLKVVELVFPSIEHRMCVRHIYANIKARFGKKQEMKPLIWNIAWSYNAAEYKANLERLMAFDSAVYQYVIDSNPMTWCRAFFRFGSSCEYVDKQEVSGREFCGALV